jgi:hypothetical protein
VCAKFMKNIWNDRTRIRHPLHMTSVNCLISLISWQTSPALCMFIASLNASNCQTFRICSVTCLCSWTASHEIWTICRQFWKCYVHSIVQPSIVAAHLFASLKHLHLSCLGRRLYSVCFKWHMLGICWNVNNLLGGGRERGTKYHLTFVRAVLENICICISVTSERSQMYASVTAKLEGKSRQETLKLWIGLQKMVMCRCVWCGMTPMYFFFVC